MKLSERIDKIVQHSGLSLPKYAESIGTKTPQAIRDLIKGNTKTLSEDMQNKILSYMPDLNPIWLLTGEGEMLKHSESSKQTLMIPLIHIDSVGGVYSLNKLNSSEQYVEKMVPFPDARYGDVAILQSGNSMAPTIPAGAILQIRRVDNWREYFGYGNDFVLWLSDDRRITKQILKYVPDPQNYVTCHSYNPEAADEELPKSMIVEVWKVINVLINKGW